MRRGAFRARAVSDGTGSSWSLTIGRALGIPIRIHVTFVLLVVWYGFHSTQAGHRLSLALFFLCALFGCVVLHELGHAAMARRFGVRTREIVLYPIGGIARLENMPGGFAELAIALAGPAVNLVLAVLLGAATVAVGNGFAWPVPLVKPGQLLPLLFWINVALFAFNLIPAFPMDGGRALRALLALAGPEQRATRIATTVGQGFAMLFGLLGLLQGNIMLMFIALFVFIGATQEAAIHRQQRMLVGRTAREAMISRFETLAPGDSLRAAAQHLLATHQQDFPVVDAWNRVAGMLSRGRLMEGLARHGDTAGVLEIMARDVPAISPDADLERVLQLLRERPDRPVMVMEGDRAIGMITLENLVEFIEISRRTEHAGADSRARAAD